VLRRLAAHGSAPAAVRVNAFATELVAACLDAGATPAAALEAAGAHVEAPLGAALTLAAEALSAGATTQEALPETGALAPLAAVFRRSAQTGSAISDQLLGIAAQLRADEQYEKLAKAQRVGVLSALPLGLCMLPAFLLLAVIPAVVGLGSGLLP
jgi:pilus assembly protein TadC